MDLRYMWGLCYYRTEYVFHGLKIYVGSVLLQDRVRLPWT